MAIKCKECGNKMFDGVCVQCEYSETITTDNHKCAFEDKDVRCPLSGSITLSTKPSKQTRWYCEHHYNYRDDIQTANYALTGIITGEIKSNTRPWNDEIVNKGMEKLYETNREIFIKDAEPGEIAEVCLSLMRSMKSRRAKLPYDQTRQQAEGKARLPQKITQEQIESAPVEKYFET